MKISCIQMDVAFGEPSKNYERVKALIEKAYENNPDVILLPEMWNVGFFPKENLPELSDKNGERVKREIGALAKKLSVNIVAGSVANIKDGKAYNTLYAFGRNGEVICEYDKTHLFSLMGEDTFFSKGDSFKTFSLDGIKCGAVICYDLRFPELTRSMATEGLDVLFVASEWPDVRISHYTTLAKARAIENQAFVVCANGCGRAENTVFGGMSAIYSPLGETLAEAPETEEIITAECNIESLLEIRRSINVFCDRRTEIYKV